MRQLNPWFFLITLAVLGTWGAIAQAAPPPLTMEPPSAASGSRDGAPDRKPDPKLRALLLAAANDSNSFADKFDAEVWLLDMSTRLREWVPDPGERFQILKTAHHEASRASLPAEIVLSVITVESRFDRLAISEAGARGLMQVMPFWLKEIGRPDDNLFDVRTNMRFGCTILRYYLDLEKGNLRKALARYNGSAGKNWYPKLVMQAYQATWLP